MAELIKILNAMDDQTLRRQALYQIGAEAFFREQPKMTDEQLAVVHQIRNALTVVRRALSARGLADPTLKAEHTRGGSVAPKPSDKGHT